jgi:hypothetical protein
MHSMVLAIIPSNLRIYGKLFNVYVANEFKSRGDSACSLKLSKNIQFGTAYKCGRNSEKARVFFQPNCTSYNMVREVR